MKKLRVLHVAECIGGVDRYLRSLLKYSTCENVMILSQLYEDKKDIYEQLASHVEIMHMQHGMKPSAVREAIELRKRIKKYNPDVVYAHSSTAGAIVRMACVGLKVKVVYNPHGWSFNMEGRPKRLFVTLERIMSLFCSFKYVSNDYEVSVRDFLPHFGSHSYKYIWSFLPTNAANHSDHKCIIRKS